MREKKKGTSGNAANYTTRAQALKKLQLSLADFRRLCILKGIYPREPKKKFDGATKTYYLTKDIKFLAHEPLLAKFREIRAYRKKIKRARAKRDQGQLNLLLKNRPTYKLDRLVRERYPTFEDAIRDLDDALTMVHLFHRLPSHDQIKPHRVRNCEKLVREFRNFIALTGALDRVFVSIKGVYFSAKVNGERVVWVEPHNFTPELPNDVDFRVMLTFLEFYECLLGFVNFRLYSGRGLSYPPELNKVDAAGSHLSDLRVERAPEQPTGETVAADQVDKVQAKVAGIVKKELAQGAEDEDDEDDDDDVQDEDTEMTSTTQDATPAEKDGEVARGGIFRGLKVFLGRETPVVALEFVLATHGAEVGWEGESSLFSSDDKKITHWIMDRPAVPGARRVNVEYVQPQWAYDSVNNGSVLPTALYGVGVSLPPHLSPFVDDEAEGYVPKYRTYLERLRAGDRDLYKESALAAAADSDAEDAGGDDAQPGDDEAADLEGDKIAEAGADDNDDDADEEEDDDEEDGEAEDDEVEQEEEEDDDDDDDDGDSMDEDAVKDESAEKDSAKDAKQLAKLMMSRKKRNLYDRMVFGKRRRSQEVQRLEQRAEELESKRSKKSKRASTS